MNTGHGHVFPRPDGVKFRCGGPAFCDICKQDLVVKNAQEQSSGDLANVIRELRLNGYHDWAIRIERAAQPSRPAHEREPPHCSTCSCGLAG